MPIGPQKLADGEIWAICLKRRDQAAHFAPHLHDRNPFLFYDLHERARQPSHSPQSTHKYKPFYISAYLAYSSRHTHTHTHPQRHYGVSEVLSGVGHCLRFGL